MSGHEYVFIDQVILQHPLEREIEEQFNAVITIVGLDDNPTHQTIEVT